MAESANMARIWTVYAAPSANASDAEWRSRSDGMRKKTEAMERRLHGKQDWLANANCGK